MFVLFVVVMAKFAVVQTLQARLASRLAVRLYPAILQVINGGDHDRHGTRSRGDTIANACSNEAWPASRCWGLPPIASLSAPWPNAWPRRGRKPSVCGRLSARRQLTKVRSATASTRRCVVHRWSEPTSSPDAKSRRVPRSNCDPLPARHEHHQRRRQARTVAFAGGLDVGASR